MSTILIANGKAVERAVARQFTEAGYNLIFMGGTKAAKRTANWINQNTTQIAYIVETSFAQKDDVAHSIDALLQTTEAPAQIDHVISNARPPEPGDRTINKTPPAVMEKTLSSNIEYHYRIVHQLLPIIKDEGTVTFTATTNLSNQAGICYKTAIAGLYGFIQKINGALNQSRGIRINGVYPQSFTNQSTLSDYVKSPDNSGDIIDKVTQTIINIIKGEVNNEGGNLYSIKS